MAWLIIIWLTWYCYDDGVASLAGEPVIGQLHPVLWLIMLVLLLALTPKTDTKK